MQANGEDCRHRRCHDAPWGNPRQQRPFAPTQAGARRAQQHIQRAGDELNDQQQNQHQRPEADHGVQVQPCRQQNEQAGDQQHAEVLLEVQDVPHVHAFHVGQPHAHQGHGQQSGFVGDFVGANENTQYCRERCQVVQVFRQPLAANQGAEQPATQNTEQAPAQNHAAEGQQAFLEAVTFGTGNDEAIDDYRQQGADGVDDNAFPAQDIGNRRFRAHDAQHRYDHGRPCHQGQAAEQDGQQPVEPQQPVSGDSNDHPGGEGTNRDQAMDDAADFAPLGQMQGQAAFEQDQRHRQGHQRHQQWPEHFLRVEQVQHGASQDAGQQQKKNRRQFQAPGQPLAKQRRRAYPAKCQ
ncbi:hypothetical protein D3C85_1085690 [compost metagenome]